ncbi:Clp protease N-terminal domain-containing protein [Streptosporangium sp. NPDC051022]|uniref:Clp protease N-terminal domain-containing protein n=1 Tax=Streptosporangium sp. NPDC051022 TaxID=3155752 RepID=UPI0034281473
MFTGFTPEARRVMVRAALLSLDNGRAALDEDMLLLALAESWPVTGFEVTADAVLAQIGPSGNDRELLATLGVDLEEIRRRMPVRRDDPAAWRLRRSRLRPLHVVLTGPVGDLPLTGRARKAVEVAVHWHGAGPEVTEEDLLRGLLADGSNTSVSILRRLGVDLPLLATRLRFLRASA